MPNSFQQITRREAPIPSWPPASSRRLAGPIAQWLPAPPDSGMTASPQLGGR